MSFHSYSVDRSVASWNNKYASLHCNKTRKYPVNVKRMSESTNNIDLV